MKVRFRHSDESRNLEKNSLDASFRWHEGGHFHTKTARPFAEMTIQASPEEGIARFTWHKIQNSGAVIEKNKSSRQLNTQ
jgi:hypothetical protein